MIGPERRQALRLAREDPEREDSMRNVVLLGRRMEVSDALRYVPAFISETFDKTNAYNAEEGRSVLRKEPQHPYAPSTIRGGRVIAGKG